MTAIQTQKIINEFTTLVDTEKDSDEEAEPKKKCEPPEDNIPWKEHKGIIKSLVAKNMKIVRNYPELNSIQKQKLLTTLFKTSIYW